MTDPIAVALLRKIEIFSILSDEHCQAIAELLQGISISAGTLVAKAGQHWSEMSIILSGKVRLVEDRAPGKSYTIDILSDGAAFGESMLFDEKSGEYSVYSLTELVLLKLRKERLQLFLRERPDIDELLKYFLTHRAIRNFVAASSLFANLSIEQLNLLVRSMVSQELAPGEMLVRQGDQPLGLYIIESGRLQRYTERDATGSATRLGRGDLVGETPLLKRTKHDATVVAETEATAFFVHRAVFYSLVEEEMETTIPLQKPTSRDAVAKETSDTAGRAASRIQTGIGEKERLSHPTLRRFRSYIRPFRRLLYEIGLASLSIQILNLFLPIFAKFIIDDVIARRDERWLILLFAGAFVGVALNLAAGICRQHLLLFVTWRLNLLLGSDFYQHVLTLPVPFFQKHTVGDLINRFEENNKVTQFFTSTGVDFFIDLVTAFLYLTLMFYYSVRLTLVALIFLALHILNLYFLTPYLKQGFQNVFLNRSQTESGLIETLTGLKTIKTLAIEHYTRWNIENLLVRLANASFKTIRQGMMSSLASQLIQSAGAITTLFYGAWMVLDDELSVGELVAFTILVQGLSAPMTKVVSAWDSLQETVNAMNRLNDVFETPAEVSIGQEGNGEVSHYLEGRVRFQHVTFRYDERGPEVLHGINLDVRQGQRVAVVGRSGSGKSTLLKLLLGFYPPASGKIFLDDAASEDFEWHAMRGQMGVVLQDTYLFNDTIRTNISWAKPEASTREVIEAAKLVGAHDLISNMPMGYETILEENGSNLSGGQRQRLAIARAILHRPRVLLLDEATSALDEESERLFFHNLDTALRDSTIFLISQRLTSARYADLIVVLDRGEIIELGTHEELMAQKGTYCLMTTRQLNL